MGKKKYILYGSTYLEWLLLVLVLVFIFTSWRQVIQKELVSQPIVIDRDKTAANNKTSTVTFLSQGDNPPGASGYAPEGLLQPCNQKPNNKIVPNLPGSHEQQPCDSSQGLVCINGVVEGGGICLKDVNQSCIFRSECTPSADGCFYGFCQTFGDMINKPCTTDSQCMENGKFNHICDPVSKRCKFNLFPKDAGCMLDEQCAFYTDFDTPNQSGCLNQKPLINYSATYSSDDFTITGTTLLLKDYYIGLKSTKTGFLGRYLISELNITGGNTVIKLFKYTHNNSNGNNYTIELGGPVGGGICVIKLPLGTKQNPIISSNTEILRPCEEELDSLDNFCVEKGRNSKKGSLGQVCNDQGLGCQDNLKCTFVEEFSTRLSANKNAIGDTTRGLSIGGVFVNNIGRCANQSSINRENCDEPEKACIAPNICLNQEDFTGANFRYCGRNWNTFETSSLIGCPEGYTYNSDNNECLANSGEICIRNEDCRLVNGGHTDCSESKKLFFFDPIQAKFENSNLLSGSNITKNDKLLMSKDFKTVGTTTIPTAIGYYNFQNSSLGVNLKTNIQRNITINFENTSIKEPQVSIIKLDDNTHQLNVIYKETYKNYTRREYYFTDTGGKITNTFALRQGASIFFEDIGNTGDTNIQGIYSLDYNNVSAFDANNATISNLSAVGTPNTYTTIITNPIDSYKMVSYDSGFKFNTTEPNTASGGIKFTSSNTNTTNNNFQYLNLYPGTSLTYVDSENNTDIAFYDDDGLPVSLENGTVYYNSSTPESNLLLLTDNSKTVFNQPTIDNNIINNRFASVTLFSDYSTDSAFMELPEMEGINIFSYQITNSTSNNINLTINNREELYGPNAPTNYQNIQYNYPVGFFVPKNTDVDVEVGKSEITITNKLNKLVNQVSRIKYTTTDTFDTDYQYQDGNVVKNANRIKYTPQGGTSTPLYTNFELINNYSLPNPKIYSGTGYSSFSGSDLVFTQPFEIDRSEPYIYQSTDNDTINVFASYKNIKPEQIAQNANFNRINILNEISMRKITYNGFQGTNFKSIEYRGVTSSPTNPIGGDDNTTTMNINPLVETFGYSCPVKIGKIVSSETSQQEIEDNYYVPGSGRIYITNPQDIDVFLKYSSSELVIGLYTEELNNTDPEFQVSDVPDRYIGITNIISYDIDEDLNEVLVLNTNTLMNSTLISGKDPYLFVNNIVPIVNYTDGPLTYKDGSLIITSCIKEPGQYFNSLTGYNKIYIQIGNQVNYQFYNIREYKNVGSTDSPPLGDNIYFSQLGDRGWLTDINQKQFPGQDFILQGNVSIQPGKTYLVNNLFLSSMSLQLRNIFNNSTRNIVDRVIWQKSSDLKGNYFLYTNTIPFYNGFKESQGSLDLSYKTPLYWSYWISELNISPTEIDKIIYSFNPGNIENNMFYYVLAKLNNQPYVLFLSTNFSLTNIAESEPVPIKLKSSDFDKVKKNSFMTPYDRRLYYTSSTCS